MAESAKFLKKKVKAGELSLDLEAKELVVEYEVEATVLNDVGEEIKRDSKIQTKHITVEKMGENTDLDALAEEILKRCPIIQSSKIRQVYELLRRLQEYIVEEQRSTPSVNELLGRSQEEKRTKLEKQRAARERQRQQAEKARKLESASMDKIEEYIDDFYEEDVNRQLHATSMILQLAKTAGNLEELTQAERLMSALSRMLREEKTKSSDLIANILYIFYAISDFSQLHGALKSHLVGSGTMVALKYELERQESRLAEMEELEALAKVQSASAETAKVENKESDLVKRHDSYNMEDYDMQYNTSTAVSAGKGSTTETVNIEKERRLTKAMFMKQERVYFVAFHLLLNMAEDTEKERIMVKKNLVKYLDNVLDRTNAELLIVAVTFLKKISVFKEGKNKILAANTVEKLVKFVPCSDEKLMHLVLRLLYNLSFDAELREQMVKNSMIPKLVNLLKKPAFRSVTIRLLYHLSVEDKCKTMFTYTEAIPYITQLVIHMRQKNVPKELIALAINLSINPRNAELMAKGQQLKMLISRVCDTRDAMLMKLIRNLSRWTFGVQQQLVQGETYLQKGLWGQFVPKLFRLCKASDNAALLVEVIGTLANLTPLDLGKDLTFHEVLTDFGMLELLQKYLLPGFSQDDVVLEVVMFIGAICAEREVAQEVASSPLAKHLAGLLREKAEDAELVLQVLYTIMGILYHPSTAQQLIYETRMPHEVCEFLAHNPNPVIKVVADSLLDLVIEHDELLEAEHYSNVAGGEAADPAGGSSSSQRGSLIGHISKAIRVQRFAIHNSEWMNVVLQDEQDESEFEGKGDSQYLTDSQSSFGESMSPTSRHFHQELHGGFDESGDFDHDDESQLSDDHYLMRRRGMNGNHQQSEEHDTWDNESIEGHYPY